MIAEIVKLPGDPIFELCPGLPVRRDQSDGTLEGRTLAAILDPTITTLSTAERQAARLAPALRGKAADLPVEDSQDGRPQFGLARPPRCGARSPMQKNGGGGA
jgi:hypothetical protein